MVIVSRGGVGQGNGSGNRGPVEGLHGRVRQEPPGLVASPVRERQVPGEQAARQDHGKVGWAVQPTAAAGRQASQSRAARSSISPPNGSSVPSTAGTYAAHTSGRGSS